MKGWPNFGSPRSETIHQVSTSNMPIPNVVDEQCLFFVWLALLFWRCIFVVEIDTVFEAGRSAPPPPWLYPLLMGGVIHGPFRRVAPSLEL
jgi:hypothetical protein